MFKCIEVHFSSEIPGADPGFLEGGGSRPSRGGSSSKFHLIFHKFHDDIEIIWSKGGLKRTT